MSVEQKLNSSVDNLLTNRISMEKLNKSCIQNQIEDDLHFKQ